MPRKPQPEKLKKSPGFIRKMVTRRPDLENVRLYGKYHKVCLNCKSCENTGHGPFWVTGGKPHEPIFIVVFNNDS